MQRFGVYSSSLTSDPLSLSVLFFEPLCLIKRKKSAETSPSFQNRQRPWNKTEHTRRNTRTRRLSASTHSSFTSLTVSPNSTITSSPEKNAELFFSSFFNSLPRWNALPCSVSEAVEVTRYNGNGLDIFLLVNKGRK